VNHHLAPLLFVSAASINFQVSDLALAGNPAVQVFSNCGSANEKASTAQSVAAQPTAPEFFFFTQAQNGRNPVAATNAITGALIGATGLLPGATFTPARPGDYVALYATGLGRTEPPYPAGAIARQAASTVFPVSVSLNGAPVADSDVTYAGVAPNFAGLYQVNVRIPDNTPDGDIPVALSIGGISTPTGAFITVRR
jgi:uncharacterized protein (TIGR03437 family)